MTTAINLRDESFASHLQQRFGFTNRELQIALLLAEGNVIKRCCTELGGLSVNTIKQFTKFIRKKMGHHSQLQVVAAIYQAHHEWFINQRGIAT